MWLAFLTVWEAQGSWTTYMVAQDLKSSKQRERNKLGRHTALLFWILLVMSKSLKIAYVQGGWTKTPISRWRGFKECEGICNLAEKPLQTVLMTACSIGREPGTCFLKWRSNNFLFIYKTCFQLCQ